MAIETKSQQECKARDSAYFHRLVPFFLVGELVTNNSLDVQPQAPPSLDDSLYWTKAESLLRVETEMFSSKQEAEYAFCCKCPMMQTFSGDNCVGWQFESVITWTLESH
ncbi:hypothetical protein DM02DRAFT_428534 [Periconia macrospinosa]|uniref:Uncharacterized protein n=1 Tax=Periconia macrospinosa TaxID=97972 RepID=A0A2V1DQF8_9PLEO|nr:hypothetical protein DM02DRAFT_428534 [Periconia macrospinosa]